jgi:NhaA family Na+:H+ antiporter
VLIALIWANTASESYFRFSQALAFPVNEIAMAFFLALIAQEVFEALMPGGALHTWRLWGTTLAAAAGGLIGTALTYLLYVRLEHQQVLEQAWPVACAVDIAAGYYLLKLIFTRSTALPFLLLVAVVTDAFTLVVLALQPPFDGIQPGGVVLMVAAIGSAAVMRLRKVRSYWPYVVVSGTLSWWAFYVEGVHAALALVPIVPFLPHEPRGFDVLADPPDDDHEHHFEHEWNSVVQALLFMFGIVNAGVMLHGYGAGTWATLTASLVGRPLGILAGVGVAMAVGLHLPRRFTWRVLIVVALAMSSGFTFALFVAPGLIPVGPVLSEIKLGALISIAGAFCTLGAARAFKIGRFARD